MARAIVEIIVERLEKGYTPRAAPGEVGPTMWGIYSYWAERIDPAVAAKVRAGTLSFAEAVDYLMKHYVRPIGLVELAEVNVGIAFLLTSAHIHGGGRRDGNDDWFELLSGLLGSPVEGADVHGYAGRARFVRWLTELHRSGAVTEPAVMEAVQRAVPVMLSTRTMLGLVRRVHSEVDIFEDLNEVQRALNALRLRA